MKAEALQLEPAELQELWAPAYWGHPGPGFVLDRLTVVGPYPSLGFFKEVRSRFAPRSIYLVVDESWRESEIEDIRALFSKGTVKVRYASCASLVHAKLYLSQWLHQGRDRRVNALAWGSANASHAAFFRRNAETLSVVSLAKVEGGAAAEEYFRQLRQKRGSVPGGDLMLGPVRLTLPAFSFRSERGLVSFDAWIQSGFLCHKFEPDQNFGKLSVHLKQPLPKSALELAAERFQLKATTEKKVLQSPYVRNVGKSQGGAPKWRSTYFVETLLGHWTSERCYEDHIRESIPRNARRERALVEIRQAGRDEQEHWIDEWIDQLEDFKTYLRKVKLRPGDYFKMKSPKDIDQKLYRSRAQRQLSQQKMQAESEAFASRYCSGFDFNSVPSLRGQAEFHDAFFESFCESALNALRKGKTCNRFSQTLRDVLATKPIELLDFTGKQLLAYLRDESNWQEVGERLTIFHQNESGTDSRR